MRRERIRESNEWMQNDRRIKDQRIREHNIGDRTTKGDRTMKGDQTMKGDRTIKGICG